MYRTIIINTKEELVPCPLCEKGHVKQVECKTPFTERFDCNYCNYRDERDTWAGKVIKQSMREQLNSMALKYERYDGGDK